MRLSGSMYIRSKVWEAATLLRHWDI